MFIQPAHGFEKSDRGHRAVTQAGLKIVHIPKMRALRRPGGKLAEVAERLVMNLKTVRRVARDRFIPTLSVPSPTDPGRGELIAYGRMLLRGDSLGRRNRVNGGCEVGRPVLNDKAVRSDEALRIVQPC